MSLEIGCVSLKMIFCNSSACDVAEVPPFSFCYNTLACTQK